MSRTNGILFIIALLCLDLSVNAASLGVRDCDPDIEDDNCHRLGKSGDICNATRPCERGLYCKAGTPNAVKHSLCGILTPATTESELERIVDSYPISDAEKKYVKANHYKFERDSMKFNSIPEIAAKSCKGCDRQEKIESINEDVITGLIDAQKDLTMANPPTVYRGDSRKPDQLKRHRGFFGRAPVTVEHARYIAPIWATQEMGRKWKKETGALGDMPFVAVGATESQKGGLDYKIQMPLDIGDKPSQKSPKILFNKDSLETSEIIAIRYDDEIVFLTGIPYKFITGVDIDGKGFKPMLV